MKKEKKLNKNRIFSLILLIALFVGLSLLFYPSVSQYWNKKVQSKATIDYEKIASQLTDEQIEKMFIEADMYNIELSKLNFPLTEYEKLSSIYKKTLNADRKGMIGYISIEKINVELPVYHTVGKYVLNNYCGHMEGSSLPSFNKGVHTVLSAHRGLPNSTLFTHLDKLELGDIFYLNILNTTLVYQVDQIKTVKPEDLSDIQIDKDENYCTLLTCTPYGINSHRLLVRGKLIKNENDRMLILSPNAYLIDKLIIIPAIALPIIFVLILIVLLKPVKKKFKPEDFYH